MTLVGADLGPVADLATALGLLRPGGEFEDDWLSNPGDHLSTILADDGQRDALVRFVDSALGGGEQSTDPDGLIWLPVVEHDDPHLTVYAVLDPKPAYVGIGAGVSVTSSTTPQASVRAHVPIFRAARGSGSVPTPILLGQPGGRIRVSADVGVAAGPATPGEAHLGGVAVTVSVPTSGGDGPPVVSLMLRQLQLPGAPSPRDLTLSLDSADDLGESVLELILGLIKAQADALTTGPLEALARLVGLREGGAVPQFPLQALAEAGPQALATWFEGIVSGDAARAAWLDALADLVGAGALVDGSDLHVTIGAADVRLSLGVVAGPGGHPRVTPSLRVSLAPAADVRIAAEADLLTLDLGTGTAIALPRFEVHALAGRRVGIDTGGADLLTGDPAVRAARVGFGLDAARRPVFVLAADGVQIGAHGYDTLDLTNPNALADAAGAAVEDVAGRLLDRLGGAVAAVRVLLGLAPPAGVTAVQIAQLMQNPLGAVRVYWQTLLNDHADAVSTALQPLRDLVADAAHAGATVTGAGTADRPWTLPLAGPVELHVFRDGPGSGSPVHVALAARYAVDTLGQGCTRVDTSLRVALVTLDLAAGHAAFCALVEARLTAAASGEDFARLRIGDADLRADHIGLSGSRAGPRPGVRRPDPQPVGGGGRRAAGGHDRATGAARHRRRRVGHIAARRLGLGRGTGRAAGRLLRRALPAAPAGRARLAFRRRDSPAPPAPGRPGRGPGGERQGLVGRARAGWPGGAGERAGRAGAHAERVGPLARRGPRVRAAGRPLPAAAGPRTARHPAARGLAGAGWPEPGGHRRRPGAARLAPRHARPGPFHARRGPDRRGDRRHRDRGPARRPGRRPGRARRAGHSLAGHGRPGRSAADRPHRGHRAPAAGRGHPRPGGPRSRRPARTRAVRDRPARGRRRPGGRRLGRCPASRRSGGWTCARQAGHRSPSPRRPRWRASGWCCWAGAATACWPPTTRTASRVRQDGCAGCWTCSARTA